MTISKPIASTLDAERSRDVTRRPCDLRRHFSASRHRPWLPMRIRRPRAARHRRFSMVGAGRGGGPVKLPTPLPELMPPPAGIRQADWNLLSITMDANVIRPILNQSYDFIPGATDDGMVTVLSRCMLVAPAKSASKMCPSRICIFAPSPPEQLSSRFRHAADRRLLSVVGSSRGRLQQGRRARYRRRSVLLPRSWIHDARRNRHRARPIAEHQLRADDDRLRLRLHRRWMDGRARRRIAADAPLRKPERREAQMGQTSGAAADHERDRV